MHADLKTANILMRGKGVFQDGWRRLFGRAMGVIPGGGAESASGAASASGDASASGCVCVDERLELTYHLPASFEVSSFRTMYTSTERIPKFVVRADLQSDLRFA